MSFTSNDANPLAGPTVEHLYREHRPWLMGWLRRKLGCAHHAEDMTQDVFTRILQGSKQIHAGQARAFLVTVARGMVVDHWRHRALESAYLEYLAGLPQAHAPSAQERLEIMQALSALDRMLDGLPARARQAFLLSQLDGLSYAEIAARLGVSVSSVQQYMVKAMSACYEVFHA
ncbi:sigma-70 family RNA polymerase sigma factor [Bordetella genomosp. 12]|uniref:RNA polymerase subunit sigma n=1 Tax=Bordetella genomosp. 12 TaxID=463035 RepID=A0A261VKU6_9BORD|nr:sigma-70 family RNA polymerase sigma factor [Bordetella genomosp. 12]OZI74210.1 RNA polymerase subunit sigma [Bordetella genomosp. 12]